MDLLKEQPKRYRRKAVRKRGPAQRKLGRPSKFDQIDIAKLMTDVAEGVPVPIASMAVGIDPKTFYRWLDERPEFAQMLAAEKQRVIREALAGIRSCSTKEKEFRHLTWFLEHVFPEAFAASDRFAQSFAQQSNFYIDEARSRELSERAKRLLEEK